MQIELTGKTALVTGAASGIGRAIALALAQCGATVLVNYIGDAAAAEQTVALIEAGGGAARALLADVSEPEQVKAMFAQVDRVCGALDILVNCAGIDGHSAPAWETDPAAWRRVLEVNLFGAFYCAQQALMRMTPQRAGVILNITSVHETIAWSGYSAYTASKAALSMLSKTLAQEAAPFGVRVLALAPGAIQTDINKAVWSDAASLPDLLDKIPLRRLGQVAEVARMAAVLVSDVGAYVTGSTVFVDGGMLDYPSFAHGG